MTMEADLNLDDLDVRQQQIWNSFFNRAQLANSLRKEGLHPDDVARVLRHAALGLTHQVWRNSVLEDWHADRTKSLSDADMMRANAQTTDWVRQALLGPFQEFSLDLHSLDDVDELFDENLFAHLHREALETWVAADRCLPHGVTLGELGGDQLVQLREHASLQTLALYEQAEEHGVATVLLFLAVRGLTNETSRWWSHDDWPWRVDRLISALADRAHPWWQRDSDIEYPALAETMDLDQLRACLLNGPHHLSNEEAEMCLEAGIGFMSPNREAFRTPE